tara:strand:+ start:223 stop:588 length:366 start_codon:yes stop_codon:yes gene_type:complete
MPETNPPPIRVPSKFASDPELFSYFEQELHTFLRLLWARVGQGGIDDDAVFASAAMPSLAAIAGLKQDLQGIALQSLLHPVRKDQDIEILKREIASVKAQLGRYSALSQRIDNLEKQCLSQ